MRKRQKTLKLHVSHKQLYVVTHHTSCISLVIISWFKNAPSAGILKLKKKMFQISKNKGYTYTISQSLEQFRNSVFEKGVENSKTNYIFCTFLNLKKQRRSIEIYI